MLEPAAPFVRALARVVRGVALVALAAALVLAAALFRDGPPDRTARAVVAVVLALAFFVPGTILYAFHRALLEVAEIPGRLRRLPGSAREHLARLAALVVSARDPRRPAWQELPLRVWRLFRLAGSARELLAPHAPLVALVSPPFLAAVGASAALAVIEVAVALVVLVVLAVT